MVFSLKTLFPLPMDGKDVGYLCLSLSAYMQSADMTVSMITPRNRLKTAIPFHSPATSFPLDLLPYRYFPSFYRWMLVRHFMSNLHGADAVYLWSDIPIELSRALNRMKLMVFREKFNCHKAEARNILLQAYDLLKWPEHVEITEAMIAKEREELEMAHYIFCANRNVEKTLKAQGVPAEKLISSSYGWDPIRIKFSPRPKAASQEPVFLFVGRGCVRKGVPFLLEAWRKARVKGKLVFAGRMDAEIRTRCADHLNCGNVELAGHIEDISRVYANSDVFIFPSLEEGGPLVVYEAMAQALPSITSDMGSGGVMRDGVDGLIIDPYSIEAMAEAIHAMAVNPEMRHRMGQAARANVMQYTLDRVGASRGDEVLARLRHEALVASHAEPALTDAETFANTR